MRGRYDVLTVVAATACLVFGGCSASPGDDLRSDETPGAAAPTGQGDASYTKPADDALRMKLSSLQYRVTQRDGTEPPFHNDYWDNKKAGLYVDIVSGEPLFSSRDKFKSGTGWPSFTQPVDAARIVEREDRSLGMRRVELRSRSGDSHLGHLFNDGPAPTGLRYCINSASLRFIPVDALEAEGYGEFAAIFSPDASGNSAR